MLIVSAMPFELYSRQVRFKFCIEMHKRFFNGISIEMLIILNKRKYFAALVSTDISSRGWIFSTFFAKNTVKLLPFRKNQVSIWEKIFSRSSLCLTNVKIFWQNRNRKETGWKY